MTLGELQNAWQIAGLRYEAAVQELHASYVELAAFDHALANRNVSRTGRDGEPVRTFFDGPRNIGRLAHPVFIGQAGTNDWFDEIQKRRDELVIAYLGDGL